MANSSAVPAANLIATKGMKSVTYPLDELDEYKGLKTGSKQLNILSLA